MRTSFIALEERIRREARDHFERIFNRVASIEKVLVYHTSAYLRTVRTKSFVCTPTVVYSFKVSFDKHSQLTRRVAINLEIPRKRNDFRTEVVKGKRGNVFIIPYLGEMKLPAIRAESGDEYAADELARILENLVRSGELGWIDAPLVDLSPTEEELDLVRRYLRIKRFEELFRRSVHDALKETYGSQAEERVAQVIGQDIERVRNRLFDEARRYGMEPGEATLETLLHWLGYEHYVALISNDGIWQKCIGKIFTDRSQLVEGLRVIRDVRNELAHFRQFLPDRTWEAAEMYLDIFEGRIRMRDPRYRRLVDMVAKQSALSAVAPATGQRG